MKCIKKENVVKRVKNDSATYLVKQGWAYVAKKEWKVAKAGKPSTSQDEAVVEDVKRVKKAKGAKVKKQKVEEVEDTVEPVVADVPKVVKKAKKKISIEV